MPKFFARFFFARFSRQKKKSMSLAGKKLVFTGTISIKRADAKKLAEGAGAKVMAALSANVDIVVAGGDSVKVDDAKARGCEVWTEKKFLEAVGKPAPAKAAKAAESESDDEKAKGKRRAPARAAAKAKGKKDESSSSSEDEQPAKRQRVAKGKAKGRAKPNANEESSSDEEVEPAPKRAPKARGKAKGKGAAAESSSEDEKPAEKKEKKEEKPKGRGKAKGKGKVVAAEASSEEEKPAEKPVEKKEEKPASPKVPGSPAGPRAVRVDRLVPNSDAYTVHDEFHVKLNQTNVGGNNNKFYFIQLLERNGSYWVFTRWGRVGEPGQSKMDPCGASLQKAISGFEKKFREKTKNAWDSRGHFVKHPGKYQLVETEEGGDDGNDVPLGKLSKTQIEKGQEVLKRLEQAIEKNQKSSYDELSSQFFSLIPTDFGRKRPEPIRTMDKLREKEELLKFYLRMGFEEVEQEEKHLTPISGVLDLPLPPTLLEAARNICSKGEVDASDAKGRDLSQRQAGQPKRHMGTELYSSIMLYTSNAIYANLNKMLREENRQGVRKYFPYLRLFLEAMSVLPGQNTTLWRGVGVDLSPQYEVGQTVTWWGVSSCTSDEQVARNFMKGMGGGKCSFLTIDVKTACDISAISFFANEKESLLAPGTQLLVKSKKHNGNVTEIHLEEVGRVLH
jgi:predicted DNA-binding WGR domain protein